MKDSKKIRKIKKELNEIKIMLALKTEDLRNAYAESYLTCKHCNKKSKMRNCTIVDYQWYDENTGSPCGGFYQHASYHWKCPKCDSWWDNILESYKQRNERFWEIYSSFKKFNKEHRCEVVDER